MLVDAGSVGGGAIVGDGDAEAVGETELDGESVGEADGLADGPTPNCVCASDE